LVFEDDFDTLDTNVWVDNSLRSTVNPDSYAVADSVLTITWDDTMPASLSGVCTLGPYDENEPHHPNAEAWEGDVFVEARIRYTDDVGTWPALWMLSVERPNLYPNDPCPHVPGEWDIMENSIASTDPRNIAVMVSHNVNLDGLCGVTKDNIVKRTDLTGNNLSDWHVWGGHRTGGLLVQYIDGQPLGALQVPSTWEGPFFLLLTIHPQSGELLSEYTMEVDWVRVWQ
jgi:hypothetical protein